MTRAEAAIEAGDPESTVRRLERLAWLRQDSIEVRRLLIDACLEVDSIESRRIAQKAMRELIHLDPGNPDHRFGLAELLEKRGFDRDARIQLDRLLDRVPDHPGAHLALGRHHEARYRRFRLPSDLQQMLHYFSRAADLAPDSYEAGWKQVEALMLDEQWDSALTFLDRLLERWPGDPWLLVLTGACLARPGTYPEAAETFARAFEDLNTATLTPFEELRLIEDPYSSARYDYLDPGEQEDYRRIFWRSKDPMPVTRVNERQVEHWRRVVMADLLYAHPRLGLRGWETARGELYLRYGEPLYEEYNLGGRAGLISLPSWYHIYDVDGDELPVSFYDLVLNGNFYLPYTLLPTEADVAAYLAPQAHDHDFGGHWVSPAMKIASFRGSGPGPRTEVYLAVPVDSLADYHGSSLEIGTVVYDENWYEVARREELLELDQATIAGDAGRALVHQTNLDLRPGSYRIANQVLGDAGSVVGTLTQAVEVEAFGNDGLNLSILELAFAVETTGPERFRKGNLSVVPNATGEIREREFLVLYFEIYNLAVTDGRSHYSLEYQIAPVDREGRSLLTRLANAFRAKTFIESSFTEEGAGDTVFRNLTIDVGTLPPDRYALDLEVIDQTSGTVASRRLVFARGASGE
jgi:GWxTD domain-containing protein